MPADRHPSEPFSDRTRRDAAGWNVCTGLALSEMEQLLDWLEQCHCPGREVRVDLRAATVRWRQADGGAGGCR
jgi:hypothetical protein